ncbi:NADAR family protein [Pseudomonas sp. HK3]|jgi:ribA/ribD-fused uncharacterized protein
MTAGLFEEENVNDIFFSRHDEHELLGSASLHPFILDEKEWPTAEHYYQAMLFDNESLKDQIRSQHNAKSVVAFTKWRFFQKKKGWKKLRQVLMTRAIYTKCKTYPEVAERLLATGDKTLVENSAYDYFWGCGRDRRADNTYGKVMMNVRKKIKDESKKQYGQT